jgi:hypothetical protein
VGPEAGFEPMIDGSNLDDRNHFGPGTMNPVGP